MTLFRNAGSHPIRVAFAGFGSIARRVHGPALRAEADVEVVAVADPDPAATAAARRLFPSARLLVDWRDLFTVDDVDALVDVLPPSARARFAAEAFTFGVPIYMEKPLGLGLTEATEIAGAWRASRCLCQVGLNFRFGELVREGSADGWSDRLGENRAAHITLAHSRVAGAGACAETALRDLLFGLGIHGFDLLRILSGSELTVEAAFPSRNNAGTIGQVLVVARGAQGVAHSLRLCSGAGAADVVTVIGDEGLLQADRLSHRPVMLRRRESWRVDAVVRSATFTASSLRGLSRALGRTFDRSYRRALRAFLDSARQGMAMAPTPDDALAATEMAEEALRLALGRQGTEPRTALHE